MAYQRYAHLVLLSLLILSIVILRSPRAQAEQPNLAPTSSASPALYLPFVPNTAVHAQTLYLPFVQNLTVTQANQGLQGGYAIDDSGNVTFTHALSTQYGAMQQAGAGWVRINFRLGACFSNWTSTGCNGKTALQTYDQVVSNAVSHNLKVLGLLSNESWPGSQTDWTANNAENAGGNGDNTYIQNFALNAAGVLASHFNGTQGPLVSQWEVWNEPNAWTSNLSPGVYSGGSFIYPSNFAWLLKRSYAAIKSASPAAVVVSGGLFAHDTSTTGAAAIAAAPTAPTTVIPGGIYVDDGTVKVKHSRYTSRSSSSCSNSASSGANYLCNTYSEGITDAGWTAGAYPLDAVGLHIYIDQFTTTSSTNITTYPQDLHNAYVSFEGAGTAKQIQVTEVGWSTANVSAAVQAQNLQIAYTTFRMTSYVGRAYWFNVQDIPEAGLTYGLVDTNGVPKPAFTAFQQYAAY